MAMSSQQHDPKWFLPSRLFRRVLRARQDLPNLLDNLTWLELLAVTAVAPWLLGGELVNRNDAAAFLNLCLAAAIGLLAGATGRRATRSQTTQDSQYGSGEDFDWCAFRYRLSPSAWFAPVHSSVLTWLVLTTVILSGIVCTESRGGIVAATIAGLIALGVGLRQRRAGLTVWTRPLQNFANKATAALVQARPRKKHGACRSSERWCSGPANCCWSPALWAVRQFSGDWENASVAAESAAGEPSCGRWSSRRWPESRG